MGGKGKNKNAKQAQQAPEEAKKPAAVEQPKEEVKQTAEEKKAVEVPVQPAAPKEAEP